jgi:hypothetical protein
MKGVADTKDILKSEHEKKWVALSADHKKVISYNESLVDLKKEVGAKKVVFMKVPPAGAYLSF